jgi:hypothetical protein
LSLNTCIPYSLLLAYYLLLVFLTTLGLKVEGVPSGAALLTVYKFAPTTKLFKPLLSEIDL